MAEVSEDLRRLAAAVEERRRSLGLTRVQVKDRGGPADTTLARIEQPTATTAPPRPGTLRRLDAGLGWPEGTAAGLLVGASSQRGAQTQLGGSVDLAEALTFTTVAMPVDIIRELVRAADNTIIELSEYGGPSAAAAQLRAIVQRLTAVYATEVLERVGGPGVHLPPAIEVPFRPHLTAPLSDDGATRSEQLYRRWLAGIPIGPADRDAIPEFEARWRAKQRDIMLRATL